MSCVAAGAAIGIGAAASTAIGGGLVAGGLGLAGSAISAGATGNAAQLQYAAAQQANATQQSEFSTEQANEAPWLQAGQSALTQMQNPSFQQPFTMANFQQDPGYQFDLQQGQQAIQRAAAANGGLQGGGSAKALAQYTQGMASNDYEQAYNNYNNNQSLAFNRLAATAGMGQTATAGMNQAGQNASTNISQNTMGAANAMGAASIAQGNNWSNTLGSIGNGMSNNLMGAAYMNNLPGLGGGYGSPSNPGGATGGSAGLTLPQIGSQYASNSSPEVYGPPESLF